MANEIVLEDLMKRVEALEQSTDRIDRGKLYREKETLQFLNCGKSNLYSLVKRGYLVPIKVGANGSGLRWQGKTIMKFLADGGVSC